MLSNSRGQASFALIAVYVAALALSGCGDDSNDPIVDARPGNLVVFEGRGRLQCDAMGGITPAQSALKLTNAGVDVLRSGCGAMTGVAFAAVCGGSSGEILLHEIRHENLDSAERLGFVPAEELVSKINQTGYAWVDCTTGAVLP